MRIDTDISVSFPDFYVVHQNKPNAQISRHFHREHEIIFPLLGEIKIRFHETNSPETSSSRELCCGPGRMLYIPRGLQHEFTSSLDTGERIIALISDKLWQSCVGGCLDVQVLPANRLLRELLFYLLLNSDTEHAKPIMETFIKVLYEAVQVGPQLKFVSGEQLQSAAKDPRVQKALAFMMQNIEQKMPQTEIAKYSGLSTRNLTRLFLHELGLTPKQVLTNLRIATAEQLLATSQLSVTQVALAVGYQSLSNFIKNFQLLTGVLPSEYAKIGPKEQNIGSK